MRPELAGAEASAHESLKQIELVDARAESPAAPS